MFHNTINLKGSELKKADTKTELQEKMVLSHFIANPKPMTPIQVYKDLKFNPDDTPLTSIRRAITNLTTKGLLINTGNKIIEKFGRPNHLWVSKIAA